MTAVVSVSLAASAMAFIAVTPARAEVASCTLTGSQVANASGTLWDTATFVRSDDTLADAVIGPVPFALANGRYDIVLQSYDDHTVVVPPQPHEQWYVELYAGENLVYTSPPIADLPENVNDLTMQVASDVTVSGVTSLRIVHDAYKDTSTPNSVHPICIGFVPDPFVDDATSPFQTAIEWMFAQGITKGCNPPTNDEFCPNDFVTRGQMAAFLVRALDLTDQADDPFVDDDDSIFEADIEKLFASGITKGCNPPTNDRYCPDNNVTRGQMAAFLYRALG